MKTLSIAAQTSKLVKQDLKSAFPNMKFQVKSQTFSDENAINVYWEDGPTIDMVKRFTDKYKYGYFDSSQDRYIYTNKRVDTPQVKYLHTFRRIKRDTEDKIIELLQVKYTACRGKYIDDFVDKLNKSMRQLIHEESLNLNFYNQKPDS